MKAGLSHRGCGPGGDQSLKRFIEVRQAERVPDCVLTLLSVQKKSGNAPGSKVIERRFSPLPHRELFHGVDRAPNDKAEVEKAAWGRSAPVDHATRLLKLEFFSNLHSFLQSNVLYALGNDKLSEWSTVQQTRFSAPALSLMLAAPGDELLIPCQSSYQLALQQI